MNKIALGGFFEILSFSWNLSDQDVRLLRDFVIL